LHNFHAIPKSLLNQRAGGEAVRRCHGKDAPPALYDAPPPNWRAEGNFPCARKFTTRRLWNEDGRQVFFRCHADTAPPARDTPFRLTGGRRETFFCAKKFPAKRLLNEGGRQTLTRCQFARAPPAPDTPRRLLVRRRETFPCAEKFARWMICQPHPYHNFSPFMAIPNQSLPIFSIQRNLKPSAGPLGGAKRKRSPNFYF
jgi:hypothetical protein